MNKKLPIELSFIEQYKVNIETLEHASWRTNEFECSIWDCNFGDSNSVINFEKQLENGQLLTEPAHRRLLNNIKKFLCLQTHPALTGNTTLSSITIKSRINHALHIIDYFLLRGNQFSIATHGFNLVTSNDVMALIDVITSRNSVKASIYEPQKHILRFLAKVDITLAEINQLKKNNAALFDIESSQELALTTEQTLKARAWLKVNGCYVNPAKDVEYRYKVNRLKLLKKTIGHKVLGQLSFSNIDLAGFDVMPVKWFVQEYPSVPVSNYENDTRADFDFAQQYVSVLKSMKLANAHGVSLLSNEALNEIDEGELLLKERTKIRNRFTTLPFTLANSTLSNSIAFFLEYGEPLVDYYLTLARDGRDVRDLKVPIPPKLVELGVTQWRSEASTQQEFFAELRSGASLYNMLEVLLGSIVVLVNTLVARRASELTDLRAENIVEDGSFYFMAFNLRKSNVMEHRKRTLRPMPKIAADALLILAKMSRELRDLGYPSGSRLFEVPLSAWQGAKPFFGSCAPDLNRCLDRFCDFYQVDMDKHGHRYYIRPHQLRRNFAMLFFWHGSFGGVEVLRHFLGHSTASMTYNYVTESISGKVLRRVKASVAKDLIKAEHPATAALANLVCEHYEITLNDLHILPEKDVIGYIEDLLKSGAATIEPEYINGPNGEDYRVLYKVTEMHATKEKVEK